MHHHNINQDQGSNKIIIDNFFFFNRKDIFEEE